MTLAGIAGKNYDPREALRLLAQVIGTTQPANKAISVNECDVSDSGARYREEGVGPHKDHLRPSRLPAFLGCVVSVVQC